MTMNGAATPQISVHNRQRALPVDLVRLRAFAQRTLPLVLREKGSGLTSIGEVDVLLISDRRIAQLHQRFMQISGPTDVLTFHHGEIFISVETAARQAAAHGTTFEHELRLYLVHGLLHLHGFDDQDETSRAEMSRVQERLLQEVQAKISSEPP